MRPVVNEERRGEMDAAPACAQNVVVDTKGIRVQHHVKIEALHVEANLSGIQPEVSIRKSGLAVEEKLVHLPILVLSSRRLCRLCSTMRVGPHTQHWKVAKDVTQPFSQSHLELLGDRVGLVAARTTEVAVMNESDGC